MPLSKRKLTCIHVKNNKYDTTDHAEAAYQISNNPYEWFQSLVDQRLCRRT